jgi:hypothetical protein
LETKTDSVAPDFTYVANNCASFTESDLADQLKQLTPRIREEFGTDALDAEGYVAATMVKLS